MSAFQHFLKTAIGNLREMLILWDSAPLKLRIIQSIASGPVQRP